MTGREWHCQREGCDEHGIQTTPGRLRMWCSPRCRKLALYYRPCVDCGAPTDCTTPGKMADPERPVCRACAGEHYATWTRDAIVHRIQRWADEHGGIPPTANDFHRAAASGQSVPCVNHVQYRFGSWNAAIEAAGCEPHACGPVGGWSPLTADQRAECARRYAAGESSVQIAADLGRSPKSVVKWVRAAGLDVRPAFATRKDVAA